MSEDKCKGCQHIRCPMNIAEFSELVMFLCPSFAKNLKCVFNSMHELKCKDEACKINRPL